MSNMGWICPRCSTVWGPQITTCTRCYTNYYPWQQPYPTYPTIWSGTSTTYTSSGTQWILINNTDPDDEDPTGVAV